MLSRFLIEMLAVRLQVDEPQFWSIEKYTGRCVQCYQRRDGEDQAIVQVETGHAHSRMSAKLDVCYQRSLRP